MGILEELKRQAVWTKGAVIPDYDPAIWRHDAFGSVMRYSDYGNRNSEYGWEIDHIWPDAFGGADHIDNLRPLNWRNNAGLGGILGGALSGR